MITVAESGICIEPENTEKLADAVLKFVDSAKLYKILGSNGGKYVIEYFDQKVLSERFEKLILTLL